MDVFVTGATGYIGTAVADLLDSRGHDITGLARSERSAAALRRRGHAVCRGDIRETDVLESAVKTHDATVHTALSDDSDRAAALDHSAVRAMTDAAACRDSRFVYTSDVLVYGETGSDPVDERTPVSTDPRHWRVDVEETLRSGRDHSNIVILRVGMTYGDGGNELLAKLTEDANSQGVAYYVGDGTNHWSTVHRRELATLYANVVEGDETGVYNATSGHSTMKRVSEAIARRLEVGAAESLSLREAKDQLPAATDISKNVLVSSEKALRDFEWRPDRESLPTAILAGDVR